MQVNRLSNRQTTKQIDFYTERFLDKKFARYTDKLPKRHITKQINCHAIIVLYRKTDARFLDPNIAG